MLAFAEIKGVPRSDPAAVAEGTRHSWDSILKRITTHCGNHWEICHLRDGGCGARFHYILLRHNHVRIGGNRLISDFGEREVFDQRIRRDQFQFGCRPASPSRGSTRR